VLLPPWWGKVGMGGDAGPLGSAEAHPHPALSRRGGGVGVRLTTKFVPNSSIDSLPGGRSERDRKPCHRRRNMLRVEAHTQGQRDVRSVAIQRQS
jgi:hypothetical protein